MAEIKAQLPVYIPGRDRDWRMEEALATITDDGEIHIKMMSKEAREWLLECVKVGSLMQVSFDYRMSPEMVEAINHRYKK